MKKFYAGMTQGVSATQVKATDLLAIAITKDTTVEAITDAVTGHKVLELINNALAESRAAYAITSPFNHVKETIANVLQAKLNARIDALIETVEESADGIDAIEEFIEDGRISRDVVEYVTDMVSARKAENEAEVEVVAPMVIERGCNLSEQQVLAMMGTRGLSIGAACTVPAGEAFVLGFKATSNGVMVVVAVDGNKQPLTYMATSVQGKEENKLNQTMEVIQMTNNNNQSVTATTAKSGVPSLTFVPAVTDQEAREVVEQAVAGADVPWELSAEERAALAEAQLQQDIAAYNERQEAKSEAGAAVANSASAQALKGYAVPGAGVNKPATPAANVNAAAPLVAPVAQVRTNAQPTNQNRGGNVQMTNTTVNNQGTAQGRQGSVPTAAFAGGQVVGRQGSTAPSLAFNGGAGAPAVGSAWANVAPVMALPTQEFTGTNPNGGQDFVWYIQEAAKYEGQIMDMATLAANNFANPHIGITGMKFCEPAAVAAFFNREVKQDDFMWVEVFFGTTSYEFMFSANKGSDYKAMIYSRNIARKQTKGGTWYCEYATSRRTDKLEVVTQADGVIREARKVWDKDAKAFVTHAEDAPFVVEVGGQGWVNSAPNYGIRVGQQVFVQLMVFFDEQQGLKAARDAK